MHHVFRPAARQVFRAFAPTRVYSQVGRVYFGFTRGWRLLHLQKPRRRAYFLRLSVFIFAGELPVRGFEVAVWWKPFIFVTCHAKTGMSTTCYLFSPEIGAFS
jgi:hypothetical protein